MTPKPRLPFFRTSLFMAILVQIPVFITVFMLSAFLTNRSVQDSLYVGLSQKASLALANLRTAASMLIKDGKQADLQRLIENAGASRMVKRIRLISAFDRRVMVSTDHTERGMQIYSPLVESVLSRNSLLKMTDKLDFNEGFEAVVPVSGSLYNSGSGADTIAVLQYVADVSAEKSLKRNVNVALIGQNGLLLLIMVVILFITWEILVSKPLRSFLSVTNAVASGDYSVKIIPKHKDEFAVFAAAFNQMTEEIGLKNEELFKHAETLEAKVAERTELLYKKTVELESTRQRAIDAERSALAGRIAGGVAHEINNPSGFIMSNLESLKGYVASINQLYDSVKSGQELSGQDLAELAWVIGDAPDLIEESLEGMRRIVKIVRSLEISAYPDKGGSHEADITEILGRAIDETCSLIEGDGRLERKWTPGLVLPNVPVLFESALRNILQNSADQVRETGTIEVWAGQETDGVVIRITDTGGGIKPEIIPFLFEPFFTTKELGKGVGIGLAVTKAIIEKAGGAISVASDPGQTVFTVTLPQVAVLQPGI
jgi:signal transduction histidine kinase